MFHRILCVCTGNVCRSPMAAGLLAGRLGPGQTVQSAGTAAPAGEPAAEHAVAVMAARGIDIGSHRAQAVTPALLHASELILAADSGHVRSLLEWAPEVRGRVFRMGHWREVDVPDPIGRPRADFARCFELIEGCIEDWMPHLEMESVVRDA